MDFPTQSAKYSATCEPNASKTYASNNERFLLSSMRSSELIAQSERHETVEHAPARLHVIEQSRPPNAFNADTLGTNTASCPIANPGYPFDEINVNGL